MITILCKLFHQNKTQFPKPILNIKKKLKKMINTPYIETVLSPEEESIIQQIANKTSELNINNITRTQAYLDFYYRFPEIHWAFLAHMVSRNSGWNMTDLKGSYLARLLTKQEAAYFFTFLERGNWLIFQDAFPQCLIYEESLKRGKSLFHLLPHFHISKFMETIWTHFWEDHDSYILTIGLIINEQSYIEERVIKDPDFEKNVIHSLEFILQDILSMSHILFPYTQNEKTKLFGQTVHYFDSLHERIELGKRLYELLFNNERHASVKRWADAHPHSGSRKDYWPQLFNDIDETVPGKLFMPSIQSCKLMSGASKIFSPRLQFAWKDTGHQPPERSDWFEDWRVIHYLLKTNEQVDGEIMDDYCKTLERLELAVVAKKAIFLRD